MQFSGELSVAGHRLLWSAAIAGSTNRHMSLSKFIALASLIWFLHRHFVAGVGQPCSDFGQTSALWFTYSSYRISTAEGKVLETVCDLLFS